MKKTTIKAASKSSATTAKPVTKAVIKTKTVKKSAVPGKKAAAAPAVKAKPSKSLTTIITANIDIGFGNTLYLRGEGAGLSWDEGLSLECVKDDYWSITLPDASGLITYKLLINDLVWSAGPNYTATPGQDTVLKPAF